MPIKACGQREILDLKGVLFAPPQMMIRDATRCIVNMAVKILVDRGYKTFTPAYILFIIHSEQLSYLPCFSRTRVRVKSITPEMEEEYRIKKVRLPQFGKITGTKDFLEVELLLNMYSERVTKSLLWLGYKPFQSLTSPGGTDNENTRHITFTTEAHEKRKRAIYGTAIRTANARIGTYHKVSEFQSMGNIQIHKSLNKTRLKVKYLL